MTSTGIQIVGMGMVSCLGDSCDCTWQAVRAGRCGFRPLDRFPVDDLPVTVGGQLPPAIEERLQQRCPDEDPAYAMILTAAQEALTGLAPQPDTGLVLATNFGLMETREWGWRERLDVDDLDAAAFHRQQDVIARVAQALGCRGPQAQLSLSCASGAAAVALARQWLRAERCHRVLCVGYDALTEFCWCGLANLRTITDDQLRPFDRTRHGTIFSEGAAALVLSIDPLDAKASRGVLLGAATNNNAFHLTAPGKDAEGSRRVMAAALAGGGITPEQVDLISAHATGTTANDVSEAAAINALLSSRRVPVMALKSAFGHLLGAAGLAEVLMTVRALREGVAPPVLNLTDPDPACDLNIVRDAGRTGNFRVALTNSAGIGGNNAATVLGRPGVTGATVASPKYVEIGCVSVGWVLPGTQDQGTSSAAIPPTAELLRRNAELATFSVKPYLHSVKGYLDPAGAYALAAAALCLREAPPAAPERTAVISVTQYGAPTSGFRFFQQMAEKGHRFASPMIFPHAYSNTAGNLVAIEFGLAGPHLVFDAATDGSEGWWAAQDLLRHGEAEEVLVVAYEAAEAAVLPAGEEVLNGALCFRLRQGTGGVEVQLKRRRDNRTGTVYAALRDWQTG